MCVCVCMYVCIQSVKKKKKQSTPINFNTNYRRQMKLIPINMDYCLLQFDALIFFFSFRGSSL